MPEAPLEDAGSGLAPSGEGWFVVNTRDAEWWDTSDFGSGTSYESETRRFPQLGFNITVLEPGKPSCMYHREALQEDFLVLSGECRLLVEGEERVLRAWDFFHCPGGTDHVFIGTGDEPCVVVMTGARVPTVEEEGLLYPVSEMAARHGASVEEETSQAQEAYGRFDRPVRSRPAYWDKLPWAT